MSQFLKKLLMIVPLIALCNWAFANDMKVSVENYEISVPVGWLVQYTHTPIVFYLFSPLGAKDIFQENINLIVWVDHLMCTIPDKNIALVVVPEVLDFRYRFD